jgi:hypothetical protein
MKYLHLLDKPSQERTRSDDAPTPILAAPAITEPESSIAMTPPDPSDYRQRVAETHLRLDRLAVAQSANQLRAMDLIRTCREFGIGLRLDPDGTLVVVSNGKAWRSLVDQIETHIDAVVELIMAGWISTDA